VTELRIGCGYDVHAFGVDRPLILGGITVPNRAGLVGHSDADVLTHAVIDALLGAAALGDLGDWFGTSRPEYQGASSLTLLRQVTTELRRTGWRIVNLDSTIVAQEPRLSDSRSAMRACLARVLRVDPARVSVKATTPDHLGAIGRIEGIAAQAVVLLEAPGEQARRTNQPGIQDETPSEADRGVEES
jgi:2-C-methyl-D-erythritol 2,4-cyclodiphosphate synthase